MRQKVNRRQVGRAVTWLVSVLLRIMKSESPHPGRIEMTYRRRTLAFTIAVLAEGTTTP